MEEQGMFSLLRALSARQLAMEQAPTLLAAWLIAEFFYKFHSFTLECGAFLLTWLALDAVVQLVKSLATRTRAASPTAQGD
jgi:hypothetical protein